MTDERFRQILSAYGANPQRWPSAERAQAEAFAARHPSQLAAALAAEAELDALLGKAERQPGELLQRRILRSLPEPAVWNWRAPVAAAAALVIGVMLGFSSGALITPADEVETYYADAFTGLDEDWADWLGGDA
ncbi:hypothetical protein [Maricaulis salignorans]|uniref:Uncharacterized protein n=1 Tax=Maricaulis salignorans TaxID=144026 RepID=A0A1G9Q0M5_9PROT|nr:hypothetical protein [Maricaulis salignorans]SDM04549.1 hypothetical protein SAMN04488568_104114 [Maricaulis salignorans]